MTVTHPARPIQTGVAAPPRKPVVKTGLIRLRVSPDDPQRRELSDREIEVLSLIAAGGTKDEISHHLEMAPSTVAGHITRIYRALGAHNAPHAVALAHGYQVISARPLPPPPYVSRRERQVLAGVA